MSGPSVWWCCNLSIKKTVDECNEKAHGAFFDRGVLGAFHGVLNPLSSRILIETFIILVLIYGH